MIDALDSKTQPLPLDEQHARRGRGRPKTGQAMTAAEKQRAYRQRLKERSTGNVTDNAEVGQLRQQLAEALHREKAVNAALINTIKRSDELAARLGRANDRSQELEAEIKATKSRPHKAENSSNVTDIPYHAQYYQSTQRKWTTIGGDSPENPPFYNWKEAEEFVLGLLKGGSKGRYRIIPANLPIKEYR